MTRPRGSATWLSDHVPLAVFLTVYVLTCLIGAVILLLNYRPVVAPWEYFSGTRVPNLTGSQLVDAVLLLTVPPLLLILGYSVGIRIPVRGTKAREWLRTLPWHPTPVPIAQAIFYALALIGVWSLARAGAFEKLDSWLSYQAWVDARWNAFAVLSFFEFVNLYTFVPLAAAWCVLSTSGGSLRRELARWVPVAIAVLLALALFQKKAALISLILVVTASLLDAARRDPRRVRRGVVLLCVAVTGSYFAMVVVPTFNRADPGSVAVYSILAPLMRTSAPALYYPIVFPEAHPFYGPDLGLDIFCSRRIGCSGLRMADDNLVVWDYMNPSLHGGSIAAPFQFALYSQAGVPGAIVGSLALGLLLAMAWRFARSAVLPPIASSVSGAAVILLSINLALDSPRNSIVVSYGALWAFVFVLFASFATLLVRGPLSRRAPNHARAPLG